MDEKRSICRCSDTPEAAEFSSINQTHIHCPCPKCENHAVFAMVAWRHIRKRRLGSDDGEGTSHDDQEPGELSTNSMNSQFASSSFSYSHSENRSSGLLMADRDELDSNSNIEHGDTCMREHDERESESDSAKNKLFLVNTVT